jgi:hypothetical protein
MVEKLQEHKFGLVRARDSFFGINGIVNFTKSYIQSAAKEQRCSPQIECES